MPFLIPDTIQDSISFYLRKEELPVRFNSLNVDFGNYEYLPSNPQGVFFSQDSTIYEAFLTVKGIDGLSFSLSPVVSGVIFSMFFISFIVFSFIFNKEGAALSGNFNSIFSLNRRSSKGYKEQVTTTEVWGEFFMIFQAILLYSIFFLTYLIDSGLHLLSFNSYALNFLAVFIALALLACLKYFIYRSIAVFFLQSDLKNWISRYFRLIELSGLILFIPIFAYVFLPESRSSIIIIIIIVFIIVRLIVAMVLLNIFVKNKVGGFYFFVYLCGTEIAPYLLFYKGMLSFISIAGNNIV
ncbi:MAG: DUF4271 domain-containing protein [Fermentimonas sp.]|nr:DUF4271 domain-containing protein [Fermentimonas sp.]